MILTIFRGLLSPFKYHKLLHLYNYGSIFGKMTNCNLNLLLSWLRIISFDYEDVGAQNRNTIHAHTHTSHTYACMYLYKIKIKKIK